MHILTCAGWTALSAVALLWWYFHVPSTIPRDIPRIPVYVYVCSIWWEMGHIEVYNRWVREPLEKHGAVAIWYNGRWSVLVAHPDMITDLLRNIELYPKAGRPKRAPGSILGVFIGDNIVNTEVQTWRTYAAIMKPGILKKFEMAPIQMKATKLVERLVQAQSKSEPHVGVPIMPWLAKFTQDVMFLCFFGFDMQALEKPRLPYEKLLGEILPTAFKRSTIYFPFMEKAPWSLKSRAKALKSIEEFDRIIDGIIEHTSTVNTEKESKVLVSHLLKEALDSGHITHNQYRSNLRITFMVGHDNIEFLLLSAMWVLGKDTIAQERLRAEIIATTSSSSSPEVLSGLPYLTSVIYELLRLFPPVAEFLNHNVASPSLLGGSIPLQPGTFVGWNAYGLHTNPHIWGSDASEFKPERWGRSVTDIQANFRRQTVKGHYIPFSMYARKCLGQGLALSEIKIALFELVKRVKWTVDPDYQLKISGPALTFPVGLKVIVEELDGTKV